MLVVQPGSVTFAVNVTCFDSVLLPFTLFAVGATLFHVAVAVAQFDHVHPASFAL